MHRTARIETEALYTLPMRHHVHNNKSSADAEMAAQCCTSRIFAFKWDTFFSRILSEIFTINSILPKAKFFGLHFGRMDKL